MKNFMAVIKGELKRYFTSPLAVVYLVSFLLLNSSFALYFGGIFTQGNATLRPMFDFMPWIYLLFVSGIAMRLWAEEFKNKTVLQILTMPVSLNTYVWGKFSAAWIFCSCGLLLTFPFVITVNVLGSPDNGVIFNSYIGSFLLAGAMLAIAQTASALTKNQVISLVIAVLLNLLFFLCGLEYVLGFLRNFASDYFVETVASFSFLKHVADFNAGILSASSLVFFISLIVVFNCFTALIVSMRTLGVVGWLRIGSIMECVLTLLLISVAFIGINLLANNMLGGKQLDWTAEKLFTPSRSAVSILRNLDSPVTAKLYYSKILGERDEVMRLSFENLKQLLHRYRDISKGKFKYRIYDVEPLSEEEDRAIAAGLQGLPISDLNAAAYFGMVLSDENGHETVIPFFPQQRHNFLEQDIIENIYLLNHKKLKLGILTSLPMMGEMVGNGRITAPWQIVDLLRKYYDVVKIKSSDDIKKVDLLLMVHPQNMSPELEEAVYNFSISGGKILAFFDVMAESVMQINTRAAILGASDFGGLPERWGFHFYNDMVVADLENSTHISLDAADYFGTTQDLIQFYVTDNNIPDDVPEVNQLKRILLTSASVFMPLKDSLIYFVPLLQASSDSEMMPSYVVTRRYHPASILKHFKADDKPKYVAAHIFSQQEDKNFELIVVGDSDMLYDSFWTTMVRVGEKTYSVPLLDNANFVLNALEALSGNETLFAMRGKTQTLRPFSQLERKQKQIMRDYKIKEKEIFEQIAFIKKGLDEVFAKKAFERRDNFTPDELSLIAKQRKELFYKKQELYDIRKGLNNYMEKAEALVKLFNIYLVPLLIALVVVAKNRKILNCRRMRKSRLGQRLLWLSLISMVIFALGLLSYYNRKQEGQDIKGRMELFDNQEQKVNDAAKIKIKNRLNELVFERNNGVWRLKGKEQFLVNQKRVRSFLNAIMEAKLYEVKSEKIENLAVFGLTPLDNENSKTTSIELDKADGKYILSFDVGEYNLDLGRGLMGAYIKLPDQFQVWLAKFDVVDLDTDFHYWTYSNLWNLQFGRFVDVNGTGDKDLTAEVVSVLLNVPLGDKVKYIDYNNLQLTLNLKGEYFNKLMLDFYKKDDKYYAHFDFKGIGDNVWLQDFAQHMKEFYELSNDDMERISNVIKQK